MKKALALFCVLVMMLSLVLAACGGDAPAENSKEETPSAAIQSETERSVEESVPEQSEEAYRQEQDRSCPALDRVGCKICYDRISDHDQRH